MSNNRRDFGSRGGGGYIRGRGAFNKPRLGRYWDNDDYYDRDKVKDKIELF
jgi:hypothetical protein